MSLKLAGYLFTGPFPLDGTVVRANQPPVVFAIIAKTGPAWAPAFRVIDVGFSEPQGLNFGEHAGRGQWSNLAAGEPLVYFFYAPNSVYTLSDRQRLAEEIKRQYDPPHGFVEA